MIKGACISKAYQIRNGSPIVHYFIRGDDGKKYEVKSYIDKPFFYAILDGQPKHKDIEEISSETYTTQFGEKVHKITTTIPKAISGGYTYYDRTLKMSIDVESITELPEIKKAFENYIEFVDRCAVNRGIKYGIWCKSENIGLPEQIGGYDSKVMPTVVTLDIETRTYRYNERIKKEKKTIPFPEIKEARNEILSIQCLDNQTEEIYVFVLCKEFNEYKKPANLKKIHKTPYLRKSKKRVNVPFQMNNKATKLLNGKSKFLVHLHEFYTEKAMLEFFIKFIRSKDYDIITAFNGMRFDYPYLIRRMGNLKINYNKLSPLDYVTCKVKGEIYKGEYVKESNVRIPGRNLMDSMQLFINKIFIKRSKNGLTDFSKDYLGIGKVFRGINPETRKEYSIERSFFEDYPTFLKYSVYDVILDFYLQKYLNIWNHFITLVKNSGCQIINVLQDRKRVRQTLLEYARKNNMVTEPENYKLKFQGADVYSPTKVGKVNNAADLDITSQYPSAIEANNISWDTLIIDHEIFPVDDYPQLENVIDIKIIIQKGIPYSKNPIEGVYFRMDRIGIFPQIIKDRKNLRNDVRAKLSRLMKADEFLKDGNTISDLENHDKSLFNELKGIKYDFEKSYDYNLSLITFYKNQWDNDQAVLKVDINAIYGNLPPFLAACVTAIGRKLINFTRYVINTLGYPAIYTDTDSVIFQTGTSNVDESIKICNYLSKKINEGYNTLAKSYNWDPKPLSIKSEEIYNPIVFLYNKTSGYKETAAKKYIKHLVADRGIKLTEPVLSHKGLIKRRDSSELSINIGYSLIYYIGMNYSNNQIIDRIQRIKSQLLDLKYIERIQFLESKLKEISNNSKNRVLNAINKLKTKIRKLDGSLDIPSEELDDIEKKLGRKMKRDKYSIEDIAFPLNLGKELSEYVNKEYTRTAIIKTNNYGHTWSAVHKKFEKGDRAFIAFIKSDSIPEGFPLDERNAWALDFEGLLHPDFKIDYVKHFSRALSKYDSLLKAVGIEPSILKRDPNQMRLGNG